MTATPAKKTDTILAAKQRGIKVLSDQGQFELPSEQRELMCLTSDHRLMVISGSLNNMLVRAYQQRLTRRGIKLKAVHEVSITTLRRMYKELSEQTERSRVVGSTSSSQNEVIALISDAVKRKASDIHLTIHEDYGTIAYRIHGDLYKVQEPPADKCMEYCSTIYQSMCDISDPTYMPHTHQDARMSADFVQRCGLFGSRVASGPTASGSRMVIRLLYDNGSRIPTLVELGYLPEQIELIEVMRRQKAGINILSGATGSGKSTTLVSVLSEIIEHARQSSTSSMLNDVEEFWGISVVTIEDPPEYTIRGAVQTPLVAKKNDEEDVRRGWARAISSCMRQDPDIMMIGEIRDQNSARAAFEAALTGHGVWTTVHVTDAVGIMLRLRGLNVDSDRMLNPEIITGLINQSLAQKLCPHCSVPWAQMRDEIEPGLRERVENYCTTDSVRLRGTGCAHCDHGIVGRLVIAEAITPNLKFMEVFGEVGGQSKAKVYWIREMQGITKCMALIRRINEGFVDPREGEAEVSPLDKDARLLGIDYSHDGEFTSGRELTLPKEFNRPQVVASSASEPLTETAQAPTQDIEIDARERELIAITEEA